MTNEQLASHIRHIKRRLDEAVEHVATSLREDLPADKLTSVSYNPNLTFYAPMYPLEKLSEDLETEIETLTGSH